MSPAAPRRSAALVALFVVFLWATSWVLIKFGLETIPPLTFAGLRYGITQGAIFLALNALPAVTVNLLWSFSVIVVAGMAAVWLSESPTALQWTGVFVATAGALIFFLPARFGLDQRFGLVAGLVGVTGNAGGPSWGAAATGP